MSSGYFVLSVVFEPLSELVNVWCKCDCISEEENIPRCKIIFLCCRGLEKSMPPSSDPAPPTRPAGCLPLGLDSRELHRPFGKEPRKHISQAICISRHNPYGMMYSSIVVEFVTDLHPPAQSLSSAPSFPAVLQPPDSPAQLG